MFDFGQGIPRVLIVLNPTARKQTPRALDMRATVHREEFFQFQHGDGRLKLIERLAAAYRAGELPDYMLEFVDSLRTRATTDTSQDRARSVRTARPVPKTRPQIAAFFLAAKATVKTGLSKPFPHGLYVPHSSQAFVAGRCSVGSDKTSICREFSDLWPTRPAGPSLIKRGSVVTKKGRFAGI
jgi:hypothetical protein